MNQNSDALREAFDSFWAQHDDPNYINNQRMRNIAMISWFCAWNESIAALNGGIRKSGEDSSSQALRPASRMGFPNDCESDTQPDTRHARACELTELRNKVARYESDHPWAASFEALAKELGAENRKLARACEVLMQAMGDIAYAKSHTVLNKPMDLVGVALASIREADTILKESK